MHTDSGRLKHSHVRLHTRVDERKNKDGQVVSSRRVSTLSLRAYAKDHPLGKAWLERKRLSK